MGMCWSKFYSCLRKCRGAQSDDIYLNYGLFAQLQNKKEPTDVHFYIGSNESVYDTLYYQQSSL